MNGETIPQPPFFAQIQNVATEDRVGGGVPLQSTNERKDLDNPET